MSVMVLTDTERRVNYKFRYLHFEFEQNQRILYNDGTVLIKWYLLDGIETTTLSRSTSASVSDHTKTKPQDL